MDVRARIAERVERAIGERVFPGCVVGFLHGGKRDVFSFGHLAYDKIDAVREDTVYDLASITKSIPVAMLALELLAIDERVATYVPELERHFDATIRDLLLYRVRGPQLSVLARKSADEIIAHVLRRGFDAPPGRSEYTNLPAFLLGLILERETGRSLDVLMQQYVCKRFDMRHTSYMGAEGVNIAPTEMQDKNEVRGIVHDESARVFAYEGRAVGHAGLFSTADDLLRVAEGLMGGAVPKTLAGAMQGLGWQTNAGSGELHPAQHASLFGSRPAPFLFGKTGFTGTSIVCSPVISCALVILSNRTYPHRPKDSSAINSFRSDVATIVLYGS